MIIKTHIICEGKTHIRNKIHRGFATTLTQTTSPDHRL
jgi:hypothetical protein